MSLYSDLSESKFKEIVLEEYSSYKDQISSIKKSASENYINEEICALNYFQNILNTIKKNEEISEVEKKLLSIDLQETIKLLPYSLSHYSLGNKAVTFIERMNMNLYKRLDIQNFPIFSKMENQEYLKKNIANYLFLYSDKSKLDSTLMELQFLKISLQYIFFLRTNTFIKD